MRAPVIVALAVGAVIAAPAGAGAQDAPPVPGPIREISFPDYSRTTLSNGAELIVVTDREQPFVSVNLVLPGGAVGDAPGREGTGEMVANLLTRGTANRSGIQIAESIEVLGGTLGASVGLDWTTVALETLSPSLDQALVVMADVVRNPTFPIAQVEGLRGQMLQGLALAESDPASIASRQFVRAVYGGHPYGRLATEESVRAIARSALVTYHERYFQPSGAVFIVAGDVSATDAEAAIERVFGDWTGTVDAVPSPSTAPAPTPAGRRVYLIDVPAAPQAAFVIGGAIAAPGEGEAAWTALQVGAELLGGPLRGRLFRDLREERGWTYSISAEVGRRRGPALFRVDALVRPEVLDSAVVAVLAELEALTTEAPMATELDDARSYLVGSIPLDLETPQQVASQLLRHELLGLDAALLEGYRSRVQAVEPQAVLDAARAAVDPSRAVIVVVGDAARLAAPLGRLGDVSVVNPDGTPAAAVESYTLREDLEFDATGLTPTRWEYQVLAGAQPVGEMIRTLTRFDGPAGAEFTLSSAMELPGIGYSRQTVAFTGDFRPLSATVDRDLNGEALRAAFDVVGGRLTGSTIGADGVERISAVEIPEGAVVGEMQEVALWLADLGEVTGLAVPVLSAQTTGVRTMRARVVGEGSVVVPAGNFQVWEVEFRLDGEPQRAYLTREAPHTLVRLGGDSAPLTVQLRSVGGG